MTHLLLSVRSIDEARLSHHHEIGILDVKEPLRGALGAADPETLRSIGRLENRSTSSSGIPVQPGRKVPLSFSAGELVDWIAASHPVTEHSLMAYYGNQILETFQFVKIGLARLDNAPNWCATWEALFESLPESTSPVAVAYFDYRNCESLSPDNVLEFAASQPRCRTILFDTYQKNGNLFCNCSQDDLERWVQIARSYGLTAVVAGSVSYSSLFDVLAVAPDYIGVRGAVCRGSRTDPIDRKLLSDFLDVILDD